ncbi:MAG TPA: type II toxin-antitoxin system RelE/ParE family toxin [Flavisolibacter sp.]
MRYFETRFLGEANNFLAGLDKKSAAKVIYNIDLAEQTNDPKLFKKITNEIWEFRTRYLDNQIRLLAFWDKTDKKQALVIATHGFIKKIDKIPGKEIKRAENLRKQYFESKPKK